MPVYEGHWRWANGFMGIIPSIFRGYIISMQLCKHANKICSHVNRTPYFQTFQTGVSPKVGYSLGQHSMVSKLISHENSGQKMEAYNGMPSGQFTLLWTMAQYQTLHPLWDRSSLRIGDHQMALLKHLETTWPSNGIIQEIPSRSVKWHWIPSGKLT